MHLTLELRIDVLTAGTNSPSACVNEILRRLLLDATFRDGSWDEGVQESWSGLLTLNGYKIPSANVGVTARYRGRNEWYRPKKKKE